MACCLAILLGEDLDFKGQNTRGLILIQACHLSNAKTLLVVFLEVNVLLGASALVTSLKCSLNILDELSVSLYLEYLVSAWCSVWGNSLVSILLTS